MEWIVNNWQYLSLISGLIITNLRYEKLIAVLTVKIGYVENEIKILREQTN